VPIAPEMVAAISRRLAHHAGLELPAWVVEARAGGRIAVLGIPAGDYVALIGSPRGASELDELIEAVRVGESRLFRHRSQIAALVDEVVPSIRTAGKRTVQVWSAGCAAGEEPYTLAAVLARALPGVAVSIIATDVSADALEAARDACYPASAWNDIPDEWKDAFARDGDRVRVEASIAGLVRFERENLASPIDRLKIRGCDVVWCRNVLIYFTPEARKRAIDRLVAAARPGGFLFVGYSESLRDVAELEPKRSGDAVYYIRRASAAPPQSMAELPMRPRSTDPDLMVRGTSSTGSAAIVPAPQPVARREHVLALRGQPSAREVTGQLAAHLAIAGLERLVVDLDADLLDDELAPVLRRARAAARAAHVDLRLRATRNGSRRWLTRHDLDEDGDP